MELAGVSTNDGPASLCLCFQTRWRDMINRRTCLDTSEIRSVQRSVNRANILPPQRADSSAAVSVSSDAVKWLFDTLSADYRLDDETVLPTAAAASAIRVDPTWVRGKDKSSLTTKSSYDKTLTLKVHYDKTRMWQTSHPYVSVVGFLSPRGFCRSRVLP